MIQQMIEGQLAPYINHAAYLFGYYSAYACMIYGAAVGIGVAYKNWFFVKAIHRIAALLVVLFSAALVFASNVVSSSIEVVF